MSNYEGKYVCICGKEFNTSQSFNAHKSHCKQHYLSKYGNLDKYIKRKTEDTNNRAKAHCKYVSQLKLNKKLENEQKLEQWIKEQHTCECCGKIMTEYYGSGRFCSRFCANSRKHSDNSKRKISSTLRGRILTDDEWEYLKSNKLSDKNKFTPIVQEEVAVPEVTTKKLPKGYTPRNMLPYSEEFWKKC